MKKKKMNVGTIENSFYLTNIRKLLSLKISRFSLMVHRKYRGKEAKYDLDAVKK